MFHFHYLDKATEMKTESIFICKLKLRLFERFRDEVSSVSDLQTFEISTKIVLDARIFNNL